MTFQRLQSKRTGMAQAFNKLSLSLPGIDAAGKPPTEFLLLGLGTMSTSKGDFIVDDESALRVMDAFKDHGNRLTIDYEHQALSDPPIQAPAAASFVPQLRNDGIWATDVRWTPKASEYLSNKEYLYFSPAFTTDDENRPNRILNVALTNLPATKNMQPLVAANQITETSMKSVLSALSLKDNANETEALSAVTKMSGERVQLLTITGKDNIAEALGVLAGWKESVGEVTALKAQIAQRDADQAAKDFDAEFAGAKKSGLLAASDDHKRNRAALAYKGKPEALVSLKGFLGALDPLVPVANTVAAPLEPNTGIVNGAIALSDEEKRIAAKLNVSHDALIKNKQRLALKAAQAPSRKVDDEEDAA